MKCRVLSKTGHPISYGTRAIKTVGYSSTGFPYNCEPYLWPTPEQATAEYAGEPVEHPETVFWMSLYKGKAVSMCTARSESWDIADVYLGIQGEVDFELSFAVPGLRISGAHFSTWVKINPTTGEVQNSWIEVSKEVKVPGGTAAWSRRPVKNGDYEYTRVFWSGHQDDRSVFHNALPPFDLEFRRHDFTNAARQWWSGMREKWEVFAQSIEKPLQEINASRISA